MKLKTRTPTLALAGLLLAACTYHASVSPAEGTDSKRRATSYADDKRVMIAEMERRMNELTRRYQGQIQRIRENLELNLRDLRPPARLLAIERTFRGYGASDQERFDAAVDRLVEQAVADTQALVGRERTADQEGLIGQIEQEALAVAAEVGGDARGSGYEQISDVQEIDEQALVTIELAQGFADVEGLRDLGEIRKGEVLQLAQQFRHDITDEELAERAPDLVEMLAPTEMGRPETVGRILLFQSDVLDSFRLEAQDSICVAVAFRNDRLPADHRFGLLQGVRIRIARGGMIVEDYGWRLDPGTPDREGWLNMRDDLVDPRFLASDPFMPGVNIDHELFDELRDFTVIFDYKTGLVDRTLEEVVGALAWQIQWTVSAAGNVRALPAAKPSFDSDVPVIAELLRAGPAARFPPGARPPAPSDLLGSRQPPSEAAHLPPERDLGDGTMTTLVETTPSDRVIVKAVGRHYFMRHRLRLLATESRFLSYLDGSRGRNVLCLTHVDQDSALRDLGFKRGDDLLSINGRDIHDFPELWAFFTDHPRETKYEVHIIRGGANRRLIFDVRGVPGPDEPDEALDEELTDEIAERLERLFSDGSDG